jgi:hypothetical protein
MKAFLRISVIKGQIDNRQHSVELKPFIKTAMMSSNRFHVLFGG